VLSTSAAEATSRCANASVLGQIHARAVTHQTATGLLSPAALPSLLQLEPVFILRCDATIGRGMRESRILRNNIFFFSISLEEKFAQSSRHAL